MRLVRERSVASALAVMVLSIGECALDRTGVGALDSGADAGGLPIACRTDADCPAAWLGPPHACESSDPCAPDGVAVRIETRYACVAELCQESERRVEEPCTRSSTDGLACGEPTLGDAGECTGFVGTCGESGTRTRAQTTPTCMGGACVGRRETITEPCTRDTDGITCGSASTCGGWGACGGFADSCAEEGMHARVCIVQLCAGGACGEATRSESEPCTRPTDGIACDAFTTTGICSLDGGPIPCFSGTGMRRNTIAQGTCAVGACVPNGSTRTMDEPCTCGL